ncbi:MAG TPA: hypothetical protein VLZ03_00505 [Thermodesulfobacteriota bacterium]|nr:hypothetical protein [Thermodesulfobacteriota bacterium]
MGNEQKGPFQLHFEFAADHRVSIAESCLLQLTQYYCANCNKQSGEERWSRSVDEASFACLLICESYACFLSDEAINVLLSCRKAIPSSNNPLLWLDILPWDLAIDALRSNPGKTEKQLEFNYSEKYWVLAPSGMSMSPINFLVENLSHPNPSIRSFVLELAWFVRKRIPLEKAARALLKNVAEAEVAWDRSLGLCPSLFENEGSFWAFADAFHAPPPFSEQYHDRLRKARDKLQPCQYHFVQLELELRRIIDQWALSLKFE